MSSSWFPYSQPKIHAKARIFCFAHSGGVASIFRSWQSYFSPKIEVHPVQLPGRETRFKAPLIFSMDHLIDEIWPHITPLLDLQVVFFGHSLGAVIAFELIQRMEKLGLRGKKSLFVSACSSPDKIHQGGQLHQLPEKEFILALEGYGAMPKQLLENREALNLLLPRLRADFSIFETYITHPLSQIETPIVALGGTEDDLVPKENLLSWKSYTKSFFDSHFFPGNHFYYYDAAQKICERIENYLESQSLTKACCEQ